MNSKQRKTVMAFGTFDYFHKGHQHYLQEAKKLGTKLIVIVARDKTVQEVKGFLPHQNERQRVKQIQSNQIADLVVLGSNTNKYQVLFDHKPDIIALGYDQKAFTDNLNKAIIEADLQAEVVRLKSHHPDKYKSSIIKNNQSK
jgi:FAD synthetase